MRDEDEAWMHPNAWLQREIYITRKACEAAIQEHRARKATHDQDFQRFMVKLLKQAF